MASSTHKRRAWWTWTKRAAAVGALAWLAHWAYVRLTTPATTPDQAYARFGPVPPRDFPDDVTDELSAVLSRLPTPPPFDEPLPAGMHWDGDGWEDKILDLSDVMEGPWTPRERPYLRACIRHVLSPAVDRSVQDLHALRGRPFRRANPELAKYDPGFGTGVDSRQLRSTSELLCAVAHTELLENNDEGAFLDALETALWLGWLPPHCSCFELLDGSRRVDVALNELRASMLEQPLSDPALDRVLADLNQMQDGLALLGNSFMVRQIMARCDNAVRFAEVADGDGWLMLSEPLETSFPSASRAWNLLTGFHNRGKAVDAKLWATYEFARQAIRQPYPAAGAEFTCMAARTPLMTALDGEPMPGFADIRFHWSFHIDLVHAVRPLARAQAIRALVGIQRYRRNHGVLPDTLKDLTPEYLPSVPPDRYCESPLHYRMNGMIFDLWSCGPDGINNGGIGPYDEYGKRRSNGEHDVIYTAPRDESAHELRARSGDAVDQDD